MSVTINGTSGVTFNDASNQTTAATGFGFKNRIINGAMVIDQRNAGASVSTASGTFAYTLDRYRIDYTQTSKYTVQQNAGSVTPPAGFANYFGVTSASAYSVTSTDQFSITQFIEGYNVADLAWGTADAKTVTLSFWVRSSLTGTFGGSITNISVRSYPFTYSIPVANTWTQISVTIPGDTSGTWVKTNARALAVYFSLGAGSSVSGTAGAWNANDNVSATGAVSVVGTNGATFYITGVQLEKGSTATSFDYRPYGTELALCQRYYYRVTADSSVSFNVGLVNGTTQVKTCIPFPVTLRIVPTALEQTGTAANYRVFTATNTATTCSSVPTFTTATPNSGDITFTVASGLTAGQAAIAQSNASSSFLAWSAEL